MSELKEDHSEGRLYLITKMKKIDTRFGEAIVLELDDVCQFFLPKRVNDAIIQDDEMYNDIADRVQLYQLSITYVPETNGINFV